MRAHYRTTKEAYILSEDKNKEIICDNPIQVHTKRPPHRAFLQTTCSTQIKLSLYHSLTLHKCVLSVYLSNGQFYYNTFPEKCKHKQHHDNGGINDKADYYEEGKPL